MKRNINDVIEETIRNLKVSEEIKCLFRKINNVASSPNTKMKKSVKDLFVISPSCKELSKLAKCYERIIVLNDVYPIRGTRTYLELAFPCSQRGNDYKDFFVSPKLAAATQNCFAGVFLISFEQWNNASELIKESAFWDLIKFLESNKENVSYVFHITPEFKNAELLYKELAKQLNLCQIKHSHPDLNLAIEYVEKQLNEAGIDWDTSGKEEMEKLIEEKIDVMSPTYRGYRTLEKFVSNLQFEIYASMPATTDIDGKTKVRIGKEDIVRIGSNIENPDAYETVCRKMGF